ncbi:hypothetical protein SLEP1_g54235 [Rubroshorea leprosula]|uniref:Uncharacterized protein n=1 Tax=Rubroshorea leprosula TaxID=152421 RepID=A0AAV5MCQ4_9ROSI|nr:hypothetical protein SLEP1_g54235 [Rubroshorea leprosula]
MLQRWEEAVRVDSGGGIQGLSSAIWVFWAALAVLSVITVVIFSCAGGASKDKDTTGHTNAYGTPCTSGCGTGCGGDGSGG